METDKPPRTHRSGQIQPHFFGRHRGTLAQAIAHLVRVRYAESISRLTIHACLPTCRPLVNPYCVEQLGGRAEQEPALSLSSGGYLGDRLDETAAGGGDLGERALQPGPRDSAAAMALVDEDAGDPPARTRRRVLRVLTVVLEPEFLRTAVLAPAMREVVPVDGQCCMRRPALTSSSFRVRGSLTPRWYSE